MKCSVHNLKYVAVWIDGHCVMLRRCASCRHFAVGYILADEPFRGSLNIDIDQIPADLLLSLKKVISKIEPEKPEPRVIELSIAE